MSAMRSPEAEDIYCIPKPGEDKRILVLLNVQTFQNDIKEKMYRDTEQDTKTMQDTFRELGFDVETFIKTDNISRPEAEKTIQRALKAIDDDPDSHSCFALCIMTHGHWDASDEPEHKHDLRDIFWFSDKHCLAMDDIVSWVNGCRGLKGKPKLFFVQSCRGQRLFGTHLLKVDDGDVVDKGELVKKEKSDDVDGREVRKATLYPQRAARVPLFPDCLISWATSPDHVSFKTTTSPYIEKLCSTLEDHHDKLDLLTMVTIANGRVAEDYATKNTEIENFDERKQMPWMASMLRKKVFLMPNGGTELSQ